MLTYAMSMPININNLVYTLVQLGVYKSIQIDFSGSEYLSTPKNKGL